MANILAVFGFTLAVIIMLACLWVWVALMLPDSVGRAASRLQMWSRRSALLGVAGLIGTVLLLFAFAAVRMSVKAQLIRAIDQITGALAIGDKSTLAAPIVQYFGWLLVGPLAAAFVVGGAAFVRLLADRMHGEMQHASKARVLFISAFVIATSLSLPIIGWLFCLPVFFLLATGSGAHALLVRAGRSPRPGTPSTPLEARVS